MQKALKALGSALSWINNMSMSEEEYQKMIKRKPSLQPIGFSYIGPKLDPSIEDEIKKACFDQMTSSSYVNPKALEIKIPTQVTHGQERSILRSLAVIFTIPGDPVGKPRQTRSDKWKKRPCVMRYRSWADIARASVPKCTDLGVYREISFTAWIGFPKSYSKKRRALLASSPHLETPDGDNILKAILDSLFPEDKRIWKFSGEKRWDDGNGARIEVELR